MSRHIPQIHTSPNAVPALRRWSRRMWIPACLAGTAGVILGWRSVVANNLERRQREGLELLQKQVRGGLATASAQDAATFTRCQVVLTGKLQTALTSGQDAAPQVAGELGSFSGCFHLLMRQAADMVRGTSSAEEYIATHLSGVGVAAFQMHAAASASSASLQHEVIGHSHQLAAQWLQQMEELPAGSPGDVIQQPVAAMIGGANGKLKEVRNATLFGIGEVLLAAFLNRKLLLPVLGRYAERAATMLGANVALAVADGPLPFGEIIGLLMDVGFSLWTAWDIFWLSRHLPDEICQSLKKGLSDSRDGALAQFERDATQVIEHAGKTRHRAATPLLALHLSQGASTPPTIR